MTIAPSTTSVTWTMLTESVTVDCTITLSPSVNWLLLGGAVMTTTGLLAFATFAVEHAVVVSAMTQTTNRATLIRTIRSI